MELLIVGLVLIALVVLSVRYGGNSRADEAGFLRRERGAENLLWQHPAQTNRGVATPPPAVSLQPTGEHLSPPASPSPTS